MFLEKLALLSLVNLAALFGLIRCLILRGNTPADTLRVTWRIVIGGQTNLIESLDFQQLWLFALPMSWRIMIFCYFATWLITSELAPAIALVLVVVFHTAWYFLSFKEKEHFNRVIRFHTQFGVVFQEIGADSEMRGKSLAELDLRKKELLVLAVERAGKITAFPKGMEVLATGDRLVLFGDLNSFRTIFGYF